MTDHLSPDNRSAHMRRIRQTNTYPEMVVRRIVHQLGYRYRLHRRDLPGTPDLVFPGRRSVIFVHGCFWHQHDCRRGAKQPSTNTAYWLPKLARNVERDKLVRQELEDDGWNVLVIWECQIRMPDMIATLVGDFLGPAATSS